MILDQIEQPNDIKKIPPKEYPELAQEIREFLIEKLSVTGGHLSSNLGTVELTMAMHLMCDLPQDKIIWDVGHQSYTHKVLTGRKEGFDSLRTFGGMSGFPKRKESDCDSFDAGHSSTSISAALGYAQANRILGEKSKVFAVIGDGALTGGMAYEALSNASVDNLSENLIIVLNDNQMSISSNVGGISRLLGNLRTAKTYRSFKQGLDMTLKRIPVYGEGLAVQISKMKNGVKQVLVPGMFFEDMGITYLGPVDGHNIQAMQKLFREASKVDGAVVVHVLTKKGKGYKPAERRPDHYHGTEAFDVKTGKPLSPKTKISYTDVFAKTMMKLGEENEKIVGITAAMEDGTGLHKFAEAFPERFFDVGIAEEHAVTFAAGLAAAGLKPVVAIYSTFLQRAYDQILHDVCIQDFPVTFAIDRAGLVGSDGETHQGIFDLSYLSSIPNMTVMAPKSRRELKEMLQFASEFDHPVAIRYPRGEAYGGLGQFREPIVHGKSEFLYKEKDIALVAIGSMVKTAEYVREQLKANGAGCTLVNARFVKPLDTEMLEEIASEHKLIVTMEEGVQSGGFGERVLSWLNEYADPKLEHPYLINVSIPDRYVEHGNVEILEKEIGIDGDSVFKRVFEMWRFLSTTDMEIRKSFPAEEPKANE